MTKDERQMLLNACEAFTDLLEMQATMNRSLHALVLGLKTQLPNLEAACKETQIDALFANALSLQVSSIRQRIQGITESLKKSQVENS